MLERRTQMGVLVLALAGAIGVACNALTGADDLSLEGSERAADEGNDDDDNDEAPSAGSSGAGGAGAAAGAGSGQGPATSTGEGPTSSASTGEPPPPALVEASGVTITEIAIYQGVKRSLVQNGQTASSTVPVVAGRDALVRVFTTTNGAYAGGPVTARLYVGEGAAPIEVVKSLGGASTEGSLSSTINFDVPGTSITIGSSFRVELLQPPEVSAGGNPGAVYPPSGFAPLGAQSSGESLRIVLVPVAYGADGSNRLPDTSPQQLARYENLFYGIYPVPKIELTVRDAVSWKNPVYANGSGWGELLDALGQLREKDNAAFDVYYYGIFAPASSFGSFCGGGCVAGLGNLGGANDAWSRAAIGLGFSGDGAAETAVHEIGHTHGRAHAPCGGAQGIDGNYPYSGAGIGTWGYDLVHGDLISPSGTKDMMGYCHPIWVSDYTFKGLFNRAKAVNNAALAFPKELLNKTWNRARLGSGAAPASGQPGAGGVAKTFSVLSPMKLRTPPMGESKTITLHGASGSVTVEGQYFPYDHLEGGVLMWPETKAAFDPDFDASIDSIEVEIDGVVTTFAN